MLGLLSACVYAGDNGFWENRKNVFTALNGYKINFYNQTDPQVLKSEFSTDKNYKLNEGMTAYKGYTVVNNKVFRKDFYSLNYVRPNKEGALHSASVPQRFSPAERYTLRGSVEIDGRRYRLVDSDLKDFVFLIDDQGRFSKKMGQIKDNNLILLETEFLAYPEDLKMVDLNVSKSVQTKPVEGFDLKYDGVRLDRIWFLYLDYNGSEGENGRFESISFPNKPGLIKINGVAFRIISADEDKIEYMVMGSDDEAAEK